MTPIWISLAYCAGIAWQMANQAFWTRFWRRRYDNLRERDL